MEGKRRVRLFRNGRSQAVRIPKDFELEGREAVIQKRGDQLIIEPAASRGLLDALNELEDLDEEFPDVDTGLGPPDSVEL